MISARNQIVSYERAAARGRWLMVPDSEDAMSYQQPYRTPTDAERAARDYNTTGIARSPEHYARLRRKAGR